MLAWSWTATVNAQLSVLPGPADQSVFAGSSRKISVQLHNSTDASVTTDVRAILSQASLATVVRVSDTPWKRLQVLPRQTVGEVATLDFPSVKAKARFFIQWLEGTNHVFGTTTVTVYPTNLLSQLKTLAGDDPVGVFDPANQLKPLLRPLSVEFQDMQEEGTDKYVGKLAIFGPFESRSQMRASLKDDIRALAKRGVAVVWLLPPPDKRAPLKPSFYAVPEGESTVVVAAHDLVAGLAERPEAQLNLLRLAEESLHPTAPTLPETETSN